MRHSGRYGRDLDTNLGLTIKATHGAIRSALAERVRQGDNVATRREDLKRTAMEIQHVIGQFETG